MKIQEQKWVDGQLNKYVHNYIDEMINRLGINKQNI